MRAECAPIKPAVSYLILGLAIAITAATQTVIHSRSPLIAKDGITFIAMAKHLLVNPVDAIVVQSQHPGYPALVGFAHSQVKRLMSASTRNSPECWGTAAVLVSSISGLGGVIVIWLITKHVYGYSAAAVAACLFSFIPVIRQNAADALSDSTALLFMLLAIWVYLIAMDRRQWSLFILSGLFTALAYWARPEGLLVFIIGLPLILYRTFSGQLSTPFATKAICSLLLSTLIPCAVYIGIKGQLSGKIVDKVVSVRHSVTEIPQKNASKPSDHFSEGSLAESSSEGLIATIYTFMTSIISVAMKFTGHITAAFAAFLVQAAESMHILLIPLVVSFNRYSYYLKSGSAISFLVLLAGSFVASLVALYYFAGYIDARHIIPLLAICMPGISIGTIEISKYLQRKLFHAYNHSYVLYGSVMILCIGMTPRATRPLHREFFPQLQSIAWLNSHANTNDRIITNSVYVPFYTQLPAAVVEDKGRDGTRQLFVASSAMKVKYLVFDTGMVGHYNREWSSMVNKKYRLIHVSKDLNNERHHTVNTYINKHHSPIKEASDTDPFSKVASTPVSVITTQ